MSAPTAAPTPRQLAAVQAYVRLLQTVRAALDPAEPFPVPPALLEEADVTLAAAGLTGRESEFFALLRAYRPGTPPSHRAV